jgi:hypothetical protein
VAHFSPTIQSDSDAEIIIQNSLRKEIHPSIIFKEETIGKGVS